MNLALVPLVLALAIVVFRYSVKDKIDGTLNFYIGATVGTLLSFTVVILAITAAMAITTFILKVVVPFLFLYVFVFLFTFPFFKKNAKRALIANIMAVLTTLI
ncbi:MAG: hypothetical protein COX77_01710 [Candidatus Komeilibacteria bacterium CG_4_10_14_0_2_um_filter_37_10]|uniref:Uncharacterized protein n=1 Tax=Candidatus Komeilibacteria bacterium CG_4_10_14_0_2_um_filter_37_10 TaxID=1974470 RepID=A0A2M7VFI4_9BACT|nr:MAG: hypothetical protein COX77_01710 [Candidatus Komeilibacteria bacterium CG_4_10_14_0_2_um_filter_37_10]PJA92539.1 MAG: hypothetical protein CO133_02640 [Candidatus Komeilibacteria bacterium CG_4_9_14_3_um_filter_37_5]